MAANRALIAALVVFVAATLSLAAFSVWQQSLLGFTTKDRVIIKYRPFFRTAAEQREYVRLAETSRGAIPVVVRRIVDSPRKRCFISCNSTFSQRQAYPLSTIGSLQYHGCCQSYSYFSTPTVLEDIYGDNVTIVQYQHFQQYFKFVVCMRTFGCSGCTCTQNNDFVNAVVQNNGNDSNPFDVTLVKVPGCCKCLNG